MNIKIFFLLLFAVDFFTLKYMARRHFNAHKATRFNELFSILLVINAVAGILSIFSAVMIYQYLGYESKDSVIQLTISGVLALGNFWFMWKQWKKMRSNSNTYDVTNDLILK